MNNDVCISAQSIRTTYWCSNVTAPSVAMESVHEHHNWIGIAYLVESNITADIAVAITGINLW